MSAVRHVGIATLAVVFAAAPAARQAPPQPGAAPALDPVVLASFTWRQLGLEGADVSRVAADAAYPARACATSAGSIRCATIQSGAESRAWEVLPVGDDGPVTPDGVDADVFYTASVRRFDRRTGQAPFVGPELADQMRGRGAPAVMAVSGDGRTLFAGLRAIWRTTNGGQSWNAVSGDLTGDAGPADAAARITALAVSPIDSRIIWAGTSPGAVHVTRDGGATWAAVTPQALGPASHVTGLEPSRFDPQSAYLTATSGPGQPSSLWRTRDRGASWIAVSQTLPETAGVRAVREDIFRRGLLFAATDRSVFFSIDDGDAWQSLQSNLPAVAVNDVIIRDADIIVATRGRGVWVLDDFSPLRQITADVLRANAFLFRPPQTWRARAVPFVGSPASATADMPWNAGGVAISYLVGRSTTGPIQIELIETVTGEVIRRFTSDPAGRQLGEAPLSIEPGLRRVVWDLRYARPEADPAAPPGARVLPGTYQVRLTIGGQSSRQSVAVRLDPRVRASALDLSAQRTLARAIDRRRADVARTLEALEAAAVTTGPPTLTRAREDLRESRDELRRLTRAVNEIDDRPSAALDAAAAAALARATAALDAVGR
jgi:hypothetical protein